MIPKVIHYIWFGHAPKNKLIEKCLQSWRRSMPDYKIIEWNESNFEVGSSTYSSNAYKNKKWAFVSDYARLKILYEYGGIYLDTDMYVLKSFDDFLEYELVLGKEDASYISAGMIACAPKNIYIQKMLEYYDNKTELITIPRALTEVYTHEEKDCALSSNTNSKNKTKIFDPVYFYPFDANDIKKFNFKNAPPESYAAHMWNYSWGHPLVKFTKRLGLHKHIVDILDKLKIKNTLKKLLGTA